MDIILSIFDWLLNLLTSIWPVYWPIIIALSFSVILILFTFFKAKEGMRFARFVMVLASFSPVFILLGLKGTDAVEDEIWIPTCVILFLLPNLVLILRAYIAKSNRDTKVIDIKAANENREQLLVYLFAMLLPLYQTNMDDVRDIGALIFAFVMVTLLFWHMNLHYLNVLLLPFKLRIFSLHLTDSSVANSDREAILITNRNFIDCEVPLTCYRISDKVYWELD